MLDIQQLKTLLMEEQYPFFTDEQLNAIINSADSINEAMYTACVMKGRADTIKVGPIEIKNDAEYWGNLAAVYFKKWQDELNGIGKSASLSGFCVPRADDC